LPRILSPKFVLSKGEEGSGQLLREFHWHWEGKGGGEREEEEEEEEEAAAAAEEEEEDQSVIHDALVSMPQCDREPGLCPVVAVES